MSRPEDGGRPVEKVGDGVSHPGPRDVWGGRALQSLKKVHQNASFKKLKKNVFRGAPRKCFPGPRCGYRSSERGEGGA